MRRIKTSGSFIMMVMLVPFSMPLQMRSSFKMTERILFPWEGRDMLELKINLGSLFNFQMKIWMQLRRTICMLRFSDRDKIK